VGKGGQLMGLKNFSKSKVPFFHSIMFKLLISFLLLSIIPIILVAILTFQNASKFIVKELNADTSTVLEQNSRYLSSFFNDLKRMGEITFLSSSVSDFLKNNNEKDYLYSFLPLDQTFKSINSIRPENIGMTLVSDNGYVYHYGYSLNKQDQSFHTFEWMPDLTTLSKQPQLTPVHTRSYSNTNKNEKVFSYVQRVYSKNLKTKGVLIIDFKSELLDQLFKVNLFSNPDSNKTESGIMISSQNGQVIYSLNKNLFSPKDIQVLKDHSVLTGLNGLEYRMVTIFNPDTGWNLTGYFQENKLYDPIKHLGKYIILIIGISMIFCFFLSFYISRRISNPIRYLQRLMDNLGNGDFSSYFKLKRRDELGQLGYRFNQMIEKINELIQLVYDEQSKKRKAEVTALQLQINPHFLYNTLESINSLARKNKQLEISKMIVLLGKLMRLSISTFDEMIPIWREVEYVRYYIELHKYRLNKKIDYKIEMDEEIQSLSTVKWILQPVVENAILHGLDPITNQEDVIHQIEIKGWLEADTVYLQVTDNGIGIPSTTLNEIRNNLEENAEEMVKYKQKIGLFNVQSRIRMHYGNEYGMTIESSAETGTTVTLKLPRRASDENN
jgi:two-component system, sensor histidine kinase YesM